MTKRRICYIVSGIISILFTIFFTGLILSQTVFKPKHPIFQTVLATVESVSSHISSTSLPLVVQLNFTLTLQMLIKNPNLVDFEYETMQNLVYYRDKLVGNLTLPSSTFPAKGLTILPCPLVLQVDKFIANLGDVVQEMFQRKIVVVTKASMPGKITLLGLFTTRLDSISHCTLILGFPSMEVEKQVCSLVTKF